MNSEPRQAVLILQGMSAYNNFDSFYRMVTRTLQGAGLDVVTINLRDYKTAASGIERAIQTYTQNHIVAAFTLNGLGIDIGDNTPHGNLWWNLRIPVISWMGDHPCYYLSRHRHASRAVMLLYEYKDFLDFHRDYVRSEGRVAYNPFGVWDLGKKPQQRILTKEQTPLIVLPKTGNDPTIIENKWQSILPKLVQRIIHNAIDDYWGTTPRSGSVSASVLRAADGQGLELRNDLNLFCFFIAQVDNYIRCFKVKQLVLGLLPMPVKVYGNGLEYIDISAGRAQILPPMDYETLIDCYYESAAIISMNPNVDDECHDRVYSAFGCGALPVTDINPWWKQNYPGLLSYSYDFCNRPIACAVEKVIANPEEAAGVAWDYHLKASRNRTFERTVLEALDHAIMHRYYTFNFQSPHSGYAKSPE